MRQVIVGLGNPGTTYEMTRHNLGALVVKAFAYSCGLTFKRESRCNVEVARGYIGGVSTHLVLPTTYMNESGRAVARYLAYLRASASDLIVAVDDTAFAFGELRLRANGSAGGHNGLKSIEEYLKTREYRRLRLGIAKPARGEELSNYVLGRFSREEMEALPTFLAKGRAALALILSSPLEGAMNLINSKDWQWRECHHEQPAT